MPITPTYPGVYIEELPSGVRSIAGVATSITAFVGRARRGPVDRAIRIANFGGFDRIFGGLWVKSDIGHAVQQYFLNGGTDAIIVRVHRTAVAAKLTLKKGNNTVLVLEAASAGNWGNGLQVKVNHATRDPADTTIFNLSIRDTGTGAEEDFFNVSLDPDDPRSLATVLEQGSELVRVQNVPSGAVVSNKYVIPDDILTYEDSDGARVTAGSFTTGSDGSDLTQTDLIGAFNSGGETSTGMYALETADLFNLLCIPRLSRIAGGGANTLASWDKAAKYCTDRRAMLIVDANPSWKKVSDVVSGLPGLITRSANTAIFFPWLLMADPLKENRLRPFAPCGAIAGLMARTDGNRGVWKAPAGIEATLRGVSALSVKLTDNENGQLNPLGVNCLRSFPVIGRIVWGARTLRGADALADQWKYIPIRRLALMIEESLYRGTQWVVFEPNDEPLWSQIRLNLGAYMQNLFRQGAFEGASPAEAYFVKCDKETTTPTDQNLGIVNIVVGFAPLKPAEFVIIKIQQIARAAA